MILNKLEFRKIREFGEIINDTFTFIRQNFKPLIKVFVYFCGFFVLASMLVTIMQQIGMQKLIRGMSSGNPFGNFSNFSEMFTFHYLLIIVFMFLNYTAIYVSMLCYIALYIEKGKEVPAIEEVWAYFKYYFFRVLASTLGLSLFMIVCLMACIVPMIYVFPAMSLFYPIMILENGTFDYSFGRSFKLLKDHWWVTAGTLFVIWIITYACMSFASLPAIVLTMISALLNPEKGMSNGVIIFSSIVQHICQVFTIIPVIGTTLCYFNLVERKENAGLIDRIGELGKSGPDLNATEEEY